MTFDLPRRERMLLVRETVEVYVVQTGQKPDAGQLGRLTDYILHEELSDRNLYKVRHNEYPILSVRQFKTRRKRESSLKLAEERGSDGRNYAPPVPRKRLCFV